MTFFGQQMRASICNTKFATDGFSCGPSIVFCPTQMKTYKLPQKQKNMLARNHRQSVKELYIFLSRLTQNMPIEKYFKIGKFYKIYLCSVSF